MNECKLKPGVAMNGIHNQLGGGFPEQSILQLGKALMYFSFYKAKMFFSDQLPLTAGLC